MRHMVAIMALFCAVCSGCAGAKFNLGYDFDAKRLFAEIEQPLSGLKK